MLSNEEKKAMFNLKDLENDKEHLIIEQRQSITTILNLIEKQSKEIEELKEERLTLFDTTVKNSIKINDKKWEDKIKAKIEELEKQDRENRMSHNYLVIPVLQSLLEKE